MQIQTLKNNDGKTPLDILDSDFEGEAQTKEIIKNYLLNGASWRYPGEPPFKLFVQTMGGRMYTVGLPTGANSTVLDLKRAIYQKEDVPPELNVLRFKQKISLDNDNAKLSDYHIQNEDAILSILVAKKNF